MCVKPLAVLQLFCLLVLWSTQGLTQQGITSFSKIRKSVGICSGDPEGKARDLLLLCLTGNGGRNWRLKAGGERIFIFKSFCGLHFDEEDGDAWRLPIAHTYLFIETIATILKCTIDNVLLSAFWRCLVARHLYHCSITQTVRCTSLATQRNTTIIQ